MMLLCKLTDGVTLLLLIAQAEEKGATKPPLTVPTKTALAGSASGKLPKPQAAKERGGVKFAPQLEIVSEAPAHESAAALGQEMSLPRDGLKSAIRCVPFHIVAELAPGAICLPTVGQLCTMHEWRSYVLDAMRIM